MKKYFLFALFAMFLVDCDSPNANYPSGGDSDDDGGGSNKSYVVTGEAKDVTYKSVTLYGEVNVEIADYETIEWGVMYSADKDELEDRNGVMVACDDALIENAYRVELSDLVSETQYYYCAYINLNNKQYKFGETKEFTTLVAPGVDEITILTGSAEDITYNSVVLYGELEADMLDYTSVQYGISYSTNRSDLQSDKSTLVYCSESLQDNSYSVALSGLEAETKYYYCAFVYVNNQDFKFGSVKNFTTKTYALSTVTTSSATNITYTSATIGGNVTSDGGMTVTERGVVYCTSQNPTTSNSKVTSGSGTGSFTCNLTNLQEGTTYYVRAYATNEKGTAYGNQVVFTALEHEYVDLGLSVKWATCNVGATKPTGWGDHFAWGHTQPDNTYYQWFRGDKIEKYNTKSSYGFVDNKTTLDLSDDAARANWGGSWRMPTNAELTELREQCTWSWTTQDGVYGHKVTSKKNGKSIFLPAAGCHDPGRLRYAGENGYYWSSSLRTDAPLGAYDLHFITGHVYMYNSLRHYSLSVRPVCP